jgi:quercetin dioxygenase-like cupin family protein
VTILGIGEVDHSTFTLWTFSLIHMPPRIGCKEIQFMELRFNRLKAAPDTDKAMGGLERYLPGGRRRVSSNSMLALAFLITSSLITISPLMAQEAITPLMSHALAGVPGQEVLMYTVGFPPGFSSPVHRHNAQVSLYVLEGSVVMQVKGGKEITLRPGQSFYENPNDIHTVSRNASSTKPAKFLVFLIKKKGAPLVIPAK